MNDSKCYQYRTIFISDFHIGAKTFNAPALLDFLRKTESETLYLVGDIIDGWKLKKRWMWSETLNQIFDELARKVDNGTKLIYVPGNHDDSVRYLPLFSRMRFSRTLGIKISNTITHKTANGKRLIVMHGDQFDTKILSEPVLKTHHEISGFLGSFFAKLSGLFVKEQPYIEINGKLKRFSLAKYLSKHGRIAIQTLNNFEGMVYDLVKSKGVDGIICGHTHIPVLKNIKDITYANTGSWLRAGNTALVENYDGQLSLLDWDDEMDNDPAHMAPFMHSFSGMEASVNVIPDAKTYRPVTNFIVRKIHKIWSPEDHKPVNAPSHSAPGIIKGRLKIQNLSLGPALALPETLAFPDIYILLTSKHRIKETIWPIYCLQKMTTQCVNS